MNISLILPFRERTYLLEEMLISLMSSTHNIDNIEVLITIDNDEPNIHEFTDIINQYKQYLSIYVQSVPRSAHFTKDYINPLARKARGRWVIPINDDCDFPTEDWDKLIHERMSQASNDDIILGLTNDQVPREGEDKEYPHFSSFPVVPKKVIDTLGYLWDERCYIWGADQLMALMFRQLAGTERLVSLTDIIIGHKSSHTNRRDVNENYDRFKAVERKHGVNIYNLDTSAAVDKLRKACK